MESDTVDAPSATTAAPTHPEPSKAIPTTTIRRSLRAAIADAMAWAVMHGGGERYVAPFVILGGSGLLPLAALFALPIAAGACFQWLGAEITERTGRRQRMFVGGAIVQAFCFAPICIAIFLPPTSGYWLMLAAFVCYLGAGNFTVPPWISVMGDLVPTQGRGRYWGMRNALCGIGIVTSFLVGGWWITFGTDHPHLALFGLSGKNFAFLVLFVVAGCARLVSAHFLRQMYEPPYRPRREEQFTLWQFLKRMPRGQYGRFVACRAGMMVGLNIVGPYIGWYMLAELHYSAFTFACIATAQPLTNFGAQAFWGRRLDRVGSKRVLSIGAYMLATAPPLLLVSSNPWWWGAVHAYFGLAISAYTIAEQNYPVRHRHAAEAGALCGVCDDGRRDRHHDRSVRRRAAGCLPAALRPPAVADRRNHHHARVHCAAVGRGAWHVDGPGPLARVVSRAAHRAAGDRHPLARLSAAPPKRRLAPHPSAAIMPT